MILTSLAVCAVSSFAAVQAGEVEVRVVPPWGLVLTLPAKGGGVVTQEVTVPAPEAAQVRDERHETLPLWDDKAPGIFRGGRFERMATAECTAAGTLVPGSVRVKAGAGDSPVYVEGKDYGLDPFWGRFGRLDGGGIPADSPVYADYACVEERLDTVVIDASGKAAVRRGTPAMGIVPPPALQPGDRPVTGVWIGGPLQALTE